MRTLRDLAGQIGTERCDARWEGAITHQSAVHCHHGIGIRFAQPMPGIVEAMLAHRMWAACGCVGESIVQGEVIGHLGFDLNRQFIALVRQGRLTHVDLAACSGIDSAGIGLLAIARDAGIAIGGARGSIRTLLGLARLDSRSAGHPTRHSCRAASIGRPQRHRRQSDTSSTAACHSNTTADGRPGGC